MNEPLKSNTDRDLESGRLAIGMATMVVAMIGGCTGLVAGTATTSLIVVVATLVGYPLAAAASFHVLRALHEWSGIPESAPPAAVAAAWPIILPFAALAYIAIGISRRVL